MFASGETMVTWPLATASSICRASPTRRAARLAAATSRRPIRSGFQENMTVPVESTTDSPPTTNPSVPLVARLAWLGESRSDSPMTTIATGRPSRRTGTVT